MCKPFIKTYRSSWRYAKGREEDAEEIIKSFVQPFELNRAPLVRSKLVQLEEKRHLFAH
nr:hypothetical protein P5631_02300 [Bacillus subtilis]